MLDKLLYQPEDHSWPKGFYDGEKPMPKPKTKYASMMARSILVRFTGQPSI
jgi:hypothetical protein